MKKYKEDGVILADEFGTFFLPTTLLTDDWIKEKGYKPVVDGMYAVMKNDTSVLIAVKENQLDATDMANHLYKMIIVG